MTRALRCSSLHHRTLLLLMKLFEKRHERIARAKLSVAKERSRSYNTSSQLFRHSLLLFVSHLIDLELSQDPCAMPSMAGSGLVTKDYSSLYKCSRSPLFFTFCLSHSSISQQHQLLFVQNSRPCVICAGWAGTRTYDGRPLLNSDNVKGCRFNVFSSVQWASF